MDTNLEPLNKDIPELMQRIPSEPANTSAETVPDLMHRIPSEPPNTKDEVRDEEYYDESNCSTPYVSAPSSPGRMTTTTSTYFPPPSGFFYSAPTSPMHYVLSTAPARSSLTHATSDASSTASFEFEFSSRFDSPVAPETVLPSMCSADELFLNGQIRPMKLCAHLSRPQHFPPFLPFTDNNENDQQVEEECDDIKDKGDAFTRSSRDWRSRNRSQRRRTRSLSPLRSTTPFDWLSYDEDVVSTPKKASNDREKCDADGVKCEGKETDATPCGSGSSSRCSSAGRSSKRWVFLKDFLRSKSEGRSYSNNKFWHNISFSPAKEKEKKVNVKAEVATEGRKSVKEGVKKEGKAAAAAKRRSAHEMHYAANRAQAEEMRKKTFLPYRQGLLGCLGFNSKSYGAINGFARALNPVSSR